MLTQYRPTGLCILCLQNIVSGRYLVPNGLEGDEFLTENVQNILIQANIYDVDSRQLFNLAVWIAQNHFTTYEVVDAIARVEKALPTAMYNVKIMRATAFAMFQDHQQEMDKKIDEAKAQNTESINNVIRGAGHAFGNIHQWMDKSEKQEDGIVELLKESKEQTAHIQHQTTAITSRVDVVEMDVRTIKGEMQTIKGNMGDMQTFKGGVETDMQIIQDRLHQLEMNQQVAAAAAPHSTPVRQPFVTPLSSSVTSKKFPFVETVSEDDED